MAKIKVRNKDREDFLSHKEQRFVEEYLVDCNATQAARRAGYSDINSAAKGSSLLRKPKIQRALAVAKAELKERTQVNAENVILELARIGFGDIRGIFDENGRLKAPKDIDDDTAAAISSIEVVTRDIGGGEVEYVNKIRTHSKTKALEMLAKHLGLLEEKVHVRTDNPLSIMLAFVENRRDEPAEIVDDSFLKRIADQNAQLGKGQKPSHSDVKEPTVIDGEVVRNHDETKPSHSDVKEPRRKKKRTE